jgi:hypothetical protein
MVTIRRYFIIAFLLISLGAFGQLQLVGVGAVASSHQSETYDYADSDSVEVIHVIDFDQFTAQAAPLISYVESNMTNTGDIQGDTGTVADNIEFVDLGGGDIILKSIFKEGWCCTENDYASVDSAGTGVIWRERLHNDNRQRDSFFVTTIMWIPSVYDVGAGTKFVGAYSNNDGARDRRSNRPMFIETTGDTLRYQYYDYAYDNSLDATNSAKPTYGAVSGYGYYPDTIPRGRWVRLTVMLYSGTTNSYNGLHAMFMDDTCQGYRSSIMINNSTDGFFAFQEIDISTFAGGDSNSYNMPLTTEHYIYSVTAWKPINGYLGIDMTSAPAYQTAIKVPVETGWSSNLPSPE